MASTSATRPWPWKGEEVRAHMTDLARELGKLGAWVRLHYVYPYPHVDNVIPLMAEGLVLPYLDIPFQHASPNVLRAMRRPANDAKVLQRIRSWREQVPDLAIRSSLRRRLPRRDRRGLRLPPRLARGSAARPRRRVQVRAGRRRARDVDGRAGSRRHQAGALRGRDGALRAHLGREARGEGRLDASTC